MTRAEYEEQMLELQWRAEQRAQSRAKVWRFARAMLALVIVIVIINVLAHATGSA